MHCPYSSLLPSPTPCLTALKTSNAGKKNVKSIWKGFSRHMAPKQVTPTFRTSIFAGSRASDGDKSCPSEIAAAVHYDRQCQDHDLDHKSNFTLIVQKFNLEEKEDKKNYEEWVAAGGRPRGSDVCGPAAAARTCAAKINTAGSGTHPVKRDRDGDDGDAGRRSTKAARPDDGGGGGPGAAGTSCGTQPQQQQAGEKLSRPPRAPTPPVAGPSSRGATAPAASVIDLTGDDQGGGAGSAAAGGSGTEAAKGKGKQGGKGKKAAALPVGQKTITSFFT
jgi:hypothetical protein